MKVHQETIEVATKGRGTYDVTDRIAKVVANAKLETGLCTIFIKHTSASLVIQENADPSVRRDMETWIAEVAPESSKWEHDAEGPDDMPSHLRSILTKTSETVPVTNGRLALGTWQAIYVWEHRTHPHRRTLVVHVTGI
jgi:secondary thiamine-phosphate synthase enzyme